MADSSGTFWVEMTDNNGCTAQSGPLDLDLYDGFGDVLSEVWSDVNHNGMIDAGDTLVSGVSLLLWESGMPAGTATTSSMVTGAFSNVPATDYTVSFDTTLLTSGWSIVIGLDTASLIGCNQKALTALLLDISCAAPGTLDVYACPGNPVNYNSVNIPLGSSQVFHLSGWNGCDSVLTVNALPLQNSSYTLEVSACENTSYDYNGNLIPAGFSNTFTLTNAVGCDSLVTVNVAAILSSLHTVDASACSGTSFDYNGTLIPAGTSQQFTLTNYLGCDSILTVDVTALLPTAGMLNVGACAGTSFDYNGTLIPAGTSQQFTLTNYLGCDSILTVDVTALLPTAGMLNVGACAGTSFDYNGTLIPAGTSQQFTLTNYLGCDSILTVDVTALLPTAGMLNVGACSGTSFDYNGTLIPAGTSQQFTLANSLGCDSILTVDVTAFLPTSSTLNAAACAGTSFDFNGTLIPAGSSQQFTLMNYKGCDSILTVDVAALMPATNTLEVSVCPGTQYDYNGIMLSIGTVQDFHFLGPEGCDSTVTVMVTAFPEVLFDVQGEKSCVQTPTGAAIIHPVGGQSPWQYSLDASVFQADSMFANLAAGDYLITVMDGNDCLSEQPLNIGAYGDLMASLPDAVLPCDVLQSEISPLLDGDISGLSVLWWNGDTTLHTLVSTPGPVWVDVSNECTTLHREAKAVLADLAGDTSLVFLPNVLKPSSEHPGNAVFRPYFADGVQILEYHTDVFDRWGNLVFSSDNVEDAWDSRFRTKEAETAVYVYVMNARVSFCGREIEIFKKGDITVVR
ncbi:MAG: gliding motility-associated C-terminal domain-containing protein [Lewinellaceae bacterium]|nr:gliding motility-associated C-terminal domain-containing protein [Lewinellaceae bacterium]